MELQFKEGDRVRLTPAAVALYGGAWPHWVPQAQGAGTAGTVAFAGERPHKPGAAPRPYYVRWDNGAENSYRVEDLEAADPVPETAPEAPQDADSEEDGDEGPSNVIPFIRRP